jgi:hypothetical protein
MKAYINPKLREILDDPAKAEEYAKKLGRGQNEEVTGIDPNVTAEQTSDPNGDERSDADRPRPKPK